MKEVGIKKINLIIILSAILCNILWIIFLDYTNGVTFADPMNLEVLSFSYKYGFIPRAFLGNIYHLFAKDSLLGWEIAIVIQTYVCLIITAICLYNLMKDKFKNWLLMYGLIFILIAATFTNQFNLGRSDFVLLSLSLIMVVLLKNRKAEWVIPVIAICCCLIHEGYVFTYANIILVALFYVFMKTKDKKYLILDILTFVGISAVFIASRMVYNKTAYNEISNTCKSIMGDWYYSDFLKAELLGVDLFKSENNCRFNGVCAFIIAIAILYPLIRFAFKVGRKILCKKIEYIAVLIAPLTIVPEVLMKVDYGRWLFAVIMYVIIIGVFLINENDKRVINALIFERKSLKKIDKVIMFNSYLLTGGFACIMTTGCAYLICCGMFSMLG